MNSAQSWSVRGIDPKVREAAREAAARQGMSLGEYLNLALANKPSSAPPTGAAPPIRTRTSRLGNLSNFDRDDGDDWQVNTGSRDLGSRDPARLAQRIEAIERRTQLAVTSLDRAVSTIDRSVLGLAARVEEAEAVSGEAAERIADALEHFRVAGDTLGDGFERAEREASQSRLAFEDAQERLEEQVAAAQEIGRRAEAAAAYLSAELENRDAAHSQALAQARGVAEEAAGQAADASAEALQELRLLRETMNERLAETEAAARNAVNGVVEQNSRRKRH